jgi:hypothetical protein
MTELERIEFLIKKGYKPNELGQIISPYGRIIKKKTNYKKPHHAYLQILFRNKNIRSHVKAHRFAFYYYYGFLPDMLDHINGNKLDNRKENLRATTPIKNSYNRKGVKGFHKTRSGTFAVNIYFDKNRMYCGTYPTEEEAHQVYLFWKAKLHIF